eukprot:CAMPEP_0185833072 /NCGR_PEP_ID=MMETSP1353-20130828/2465_1 /TAXON_ID=1077150 /ORGANISM="Erythrolobus australicus, Strain CCMP3124" /LENGTH=92 /DNA_ID=CAMNT_0028531321 /DNA_START=306 /DNA_END=584 /DNA_ORIENTATION=-
MLMAALGSSDVNGCIPNHHQSERFSIAQLVSSGVKDRCRYARCGHDYGYRPKTMRFGAASGLFAINSGGLNHAVAARSFAITHVTGFSTYSK